LAAFVYRCPNTGRQVQGFVADDLTKSETENEFEGVVCIACAALHWVNPKTGRVLGADEE